MNIKELRPVAILIAIIFIVGVMLHFALIRPALPENKTVEHAEGSTGHNHDPTFALTTETKKKRGYVGPVQHSITVSVTLTPAMCAYDFPASRHSPRLAVIFAVAKKKWNEAYPHSEAKPFYVLELVNGGCQRGREALVQGLWSDEQKETAPHSHAN